MAFAASSLMMADHVIARSVRDALFLSNYPVTSLPGMVAAASVVSLVFVALSSFAGWRWTPARMTPLGFATSAVAILVLRFLLPQHPAGVAVIFFLIVVASGSLLASSFWLLLSERLDPSTLKRNVGRIASFGTAGVVVGGVVAERAGALSDVSILLPVLAVLHGAVAVSCWSLGRGLRRSEDKSKAEPSSSKSSDVSSVWRAVATAPYFRSLALLVVLSAVGAGLMDYVFKARAVERFADEDSLVRFFAVFHTIVGVVTFLVQNHASRTLLEKLGTGRALSSLPLASAATGLFAMLIPGLPSIVTARAGESILRGSVFRTGYELFYAPMPVNERRAGKPMIDVGFDHFGEALGAAGVRAILLAVPALAIQIILGAVVALGIAAAWIAWHLQNVYVGVLESNLQRRAKDLDIGDFGGSILTSVTLSQVSLLRSGLREKPHVSGQTGSPEAVPASAVADAFQDLFSGDRSRVLRVLAGSARLDPLLVPQAIRLLADDSVSSEIVRALRRVAPSHVGQLADALLDGSQETRVRQRIPRILAHCRMRRASDALIAGLDDSSLDVRYQCARALAVLISSYGGTRVDAEAVYNATYAELKRSDAVEVRTKRTDYIFTLLSLALPRVPLQVARRALDSNDPHLRGTALEYLESVLPAEVRDGLREFLGEIPSRPGGLDRDQAYKKLMESQITPAPDLNSGQGRESSD